MSVRYKKILFVMPIAVLQAFITIFGSLFFVPIPREDRIFPGVFINGTNVGGMTKQEAIQALTNSVNQLLNKTIILRYDNKTWNVPIEHLGYHIQINKAVDSALKIGKSGTAVAKSLKFIRVNKDKVNLTTEGNIDDNKLGETLNNIASEINIKKSNAGLDLSGSQFRLKKEVKGRTLDIAATKNEIKSRLANPNSNLEVDIKVRQELPVITSEDIKNIKDVLGFGVTVAASPDRKWINDLEYAVKRLDGTVVVPGKVFSFNGTIQAGSVKISNTNEYINNLRLTGNGYCQVSSTLYQALLYSGLEIKQRIPHYKVPLYTSAGYDAVILPGRFDLIFRNNTKYPVYISAAMKERRVVINILGVRSDNETIQVVTQNHVSTDKKFSLIDVYRVRYNNGIEVKRELIANDKYLNNL